MEEYTPEQLSSLVKVRPENKTDHRFVLSREDFLKERLQVIKSELVEIQRKHPEVLSLCLFGSMVKGTAHQGSDIDGFLYVDSETVAQNENSSEGGVVEYDKETNQTYLTEKIGNKYLTELREGIKSKTTLEDKDVADIRVCPISEKIIDAEIANLLEFHRNMKKYNEDLDSWIADESKPEPTRPEHVSASLGKMFHLDIGGGIRRYRKLFIDKLARLGDSGEKIWSSTIMGTEMLENNLSTDKAKHYPRTLAEASAVYAS